MVGIQIALTILKKERNVNPMKIDILIPAALLMVTTSLWARIAMQGLELAIASTAIEWSTAVLKVGAGLIPKAVSSALPELRSISLR